MIRRFEHNGRTLEPTAPAWMRNLHLRTIPANTVTVVLDLQELEASLLRHYRHGRRTYDTKREQLGKK